ncbi:MAG: DUF2442 domain-containing protein [Candidatus Muiribacteriota bacterium]
MTLKKCGKNISNYEISNINSNGIWIIINDYEYFINFKNYPEFKQANLNDIFLFEYNEPDHLYWEKLDIDIELDSLENPERFPLKFKKID